VKNYPPSDVVFILVTFVFSQLIWYKNRVKNEYKEIERKILLETSQANIHNLVNAVPEGIVVIDQNQKILMKNEAFQKLINDTQFDDIKIIKKYSTAEFLFDESLSECIFEFKKTHKTASFSEFF
jgi:hypothetical protein